ncbi:hypothetical protein M422DRAFT_24125 [Sphaerobolus stellatus SS14]|nr:hypothetical protein M422DRAFT_24125 [Sphaerobolus stellatus SS14]
MSSSTNNAEFFPSIGSVADKTDLLRDEENQVQNENDDDEDRPVQEIESLCMNCHEQGTTRMLLTAIPFFREVIVMSFRCPHCGNQNNEIQSAGLIREHGTAYTAKILTREDLDRQVVKSESSTIVIPEFELTIPAHRGQLTTVEGLLRDVVGDLTLGQPLRKVQDEAAYTKIQTMIDTFQEIIGDNDDELQKKGERPEREEMKKEDKIIKTFTVQLDDPAGNSFIEFIGSMADPKWNLRTYTRTKAQNVELGLIAADDEPAENPEQPKMTVKEVSVEPMALVDQMDAEEIFIFPGICSSCTRPINTLMKKVSIPYFKDILIMATNCEHCGYKDNEVKSGAAVSERGKKITLRVEDQEDLSRDILKSETCGLSIPEIDLVLQPGTLGGRFTTVEGILEQVYEELSEKVFSDSDSSDNAFVKFLGKLKQVKAGEIPFTLILDDPMANSYLQSLYAPDPDPQMEVETYDRTWEQNEELGINDMVLEGYEEDHAKEMEKLRLEEKDQAEQAEKKTEEAAQTDGAVPAKAES